MKEFILTQISTGIAKTLKERLLSFFTSNSFPNNKYVPFNHLLPVLSATNLVQCFLHIILNIWEISDVINRDLEKSKGVQHVAFGSLF